MGTTRQVQSTEVPKPLPQKPPALMRGCSRRWKQTVDSADKGADEIEHRTPPNHSSFQLLGPKDTLRAPRTARALEALEKSEISNGANGSQFTMGDTIEKVISEVITYISRLERAAKIPPPPTKYHNDPAQVQKVDTITTTVAQLERRFYL